MTDRQEYKTEGQHTTAVLQKWRFSASYDSELVNQNLVLRLKFSGENRHLRKAAKRCLQLSKIIPKESENRSDSASDVSKPLMQ